MTTADLAAQLRLAGVMLLAGWVTMLSWRVLTADFAEVAMPLLGIGVVLVGIGTLARTRGAPAVVTLLIQGVAAALLVLATVVGSLLPTPGNLELFVTALADGAQSARAYNAPVPREAAPVHGLLLVGGATIVVLLDFIAVTLRRVPVSGLVLLAAYTVPVTITGTSVSWWVFVAAATLFLLALFWQHTDRVGRWGRSPDGDRSAFSVRTGAATNSALAIGAVSTAVALAVPVVVPTLEVTIFEGGGPGTREVQVRDPMVDLRRDLQRGEDVPLLWVTTDGPRPTYFRVSVLTRFAGDQWSPGDREIPADQVASGEMPGLDGVARSLPREESDYSVRVGSDFRSAWLPSTAQVSRIDAGDDWRYDLSTRDFIAARDDVDAAGRSYDFTGVALDYDPQSMNVAVSGASAVAPIFTEVPPSLNNEVRRLAASVTAEAPTRFQKAQALQQWFRRDGGFRYDLSAVDDVDGDGADLMAFLDEETGRIGYCEQFAASMAIMARTLDIPARVAVGFLEPRTAGVGTWEFSAWDMHAWPELYFPGSGWVRFEPTPSDRAEQVPGYTAAEFTPESESPSPSASGLAEPLPQRGASAAPGADTAGPDDEGAVSWGPVLAALFVLLVVAGALLFPALVRRSRRSRCLAAGIEDVWEEVRATVIDLGHTWPYGRSPRRTGQWVAGLLGRPTPDGERPDRPRRGREQAPEAAAALDRLVALLERRRYARADSAQTSATDREAGLQAGQHVMRDDAELVLDALAAGVSARTERRARWWPRSVVRRHRPAQTASGEIAGSGQSRALSTRDELVH